MIRRFINTVAGFMYGRYGAYGMDRLSKILFWSYLVLLVINIFLWSIIIDIIQTAIIVYYFFRLLSKNISARQRENQTVIGFTNRLLKPFKMARRRHKERETHIYKTCPHCRVTLRLPRRAGKHNVICPRCKNNFEVKVK